MVDFCEQIGRTGVIHAVIFRTDRQLHENYEKLLLISTQFHFFIMHNCKYIYDFSKLIKMGIYICSDF